MTGTEARLWKIHKKSDKILEDIIQENLHIYSKHMKAEGGESNHLEEENLVQVLLRIMQSERFDVPIQ